MYQQSQNITIDQFNYKIIKQIGQGASGQVYEVEDQYNNKYALKIQQQMSQQEGYIYQNFKHKNIVQTYNITFQNNNYYILMDLCQGDLYQLIQKKLVKLVDFRYIISQIADGISYLHSQNIIHRDLKPENIFFTDIVDQKGQKQRVYKIGDFGISKVCDVTQTSNIGTIYYMAPELLLDKQYDKSVDIWAFGVIIYEIITYRPIFNGNTFDEIKQQILQSNRMNFQQILEQLNPIYQQLIINMIKYNPSERLTIKDVKRQVSLKGDIIERNPKPPQDPQPPQDPEHNQQGKEKNTVNIQQEIIQYIDVIHNKTGQQLQNLQSQIFQEIKVQCSNLSNQEIKQFQQIITVGLDNLKQDFNQIKQEINGQLNNLNLMINNLNKDKEILQQQIQDISIQQNELHNNIKQLKLEKEQSQQEILKMLNLIPELNNNILELIKEKNLLLVKFQELQQDTKIQINELVNNNNNVLQKQLKDKDQIDQQLKEIQQIKSQNKDQFDMLHNMIKEGNNKNDQLVQIIEQIRNNQLNQDKHFKKLNHENQQVKNEFQVNFKQIKEQLQQLSYNQKPQENINQHIKDLLGQKEFQQVFNILCNTFEQYKVEIYKHKNIYSKQKNQQEKIRQNF